MLPESAIDGEKARANPFMFADTGIPRLIQVAQASGADPKRIVVRLAGGAQVLDSQGIFQIGKRNYLAARKILWKAGILIAGEAVGGEVSRTTRLEAGTGRMWVREGNGVERELVQHHASAKRSPERD
jgi:chemotaxis protein CheD